MRTSGKPETYCIKSEIDLKAKELSTCACLNSHVMVNPLSISQYIVIILSVFTLNKITLYAAPTVRKIVSSKTKKKYFQLSSLPSSIMT